jgi:uncharacterized protein involved in type VI secretion and phage assembly
MRPVPSVVVLAGSALKPLVALKPERVEVLHRVNAIPSARVVLTIEGNALQDLFTFQDEIALCAAGQPVELILRETEAEAEERLIFAGVVEQQGVNATRDRTELTLRLRHDLQKLQNTHRSQLFKNVAESAVVSSLFAAQKIALVVGDEMNNQCEQLVQFRCSDWQFIRERMKANAVWAFPSPLGVTIRTPRISAPVMVIRQHAVDMREEVLVEEAKWTFSEHAQPARLGASSWGAHAQTSDSATGVGTRIGTGAFDNTRGNEINRVPWIFDHSSSVGLRRTHALARGLLLSMQSARASGEFTINGSAQADLGDTVGIEGFGRAFDGEGIVTSIRHHIDKKSGWRTTLTLGCDDVIREAALAPLASGMHVGIVKAFKPDPGGLNRLQVYLPVLGEHSEPLWARLAKPYASAMSGFCFYPEPGDEVVISFFDDDPSYPVILGAMHNPKNPAPIEPTATNADKALVVGKQGATYQLVFDTQKRRVELSSPQAQLLFQQGCKLESDGALALESNKLSLSGASSVSVEGLSINFEQKSTPPRKS